MMTPRLQEDIFKMRFEDINDEFQKRSLTCEEASLILGISFRTFHRKRVRYDREDFEGRFDLRPGMVSSRKASDEEILKITKLYGDRYRGLSVRYFYEFSSRDHGLKRSYNWTRNTLESAVGSEIQAWRTSTAPS
jgi:hypothetical protein